MRSLHNPVLVLLALAAVGCGGRGDVSGRVLYKGAPLPAGRVTFVCEGGTKPALTSEIRDGAYTIPGAPVGAVKIGVATFRVNKTRVPNMPKEASSPPGGEEQSPGAYVAIPPRYADPGTSGLTYTVQRGSQTHDIDLAP